MRRGYFVRGLPGLQFALPEPVKRLRELAASDLGAAGDTRTSLVVLNACDPANLYGRRPHEGAFLDEGVLLQTGSGTGRLPHSPWAPAGTDPAWSPLRSS